VSKGKSKSTVNMTPVGVGNATVTATSTVNGDKKAECAVKVVAIIAEADLKGRWTFEDVADLGKATVGDDLVASESDGDGGTFTSIDGPDNTKAVRIGEEGYYTVPHNIGANGGGENTNEYTLMMDIRGSEGEFAGEPSLYDNGFVDVEGYAIGGRLWINSDGAIGYAPLGGYSELTLTPDIWHRVVIAVKLGESFKVYIDGELAFTASQNIEVDGEWSLYTDNLWIGYDFAWLYPGPEFAELRVWSVALTAEQIAALGAP
jgi:hypothetical protein